MPDELQSQSLLQSNNLPPEQAPVNSDSLNTTPAIPLATSTPEINLEIPASEASAPAINDSVTQAVPVAPSFAPTQASTSISNLKSFLNKALEKIRFRKKAKLEKIVKFVQEKSSITNDQTQKLLRISDATASRYLLELVKQGRLKRVGKTSTIRYEPIVGSNGGN